MNQSAHEPSDETLLRQFAHGDSRALEQLAQRHELELLGLAKGITASRSLALDVVQEVWIRVIKHAKHFDSRSSVKTWLYRILINRAIDLRANARQRRFSVTQPLQEDTHLQARATPPRDDEEHARLRAALEELPESSRLILLLCKHRGLTGEQAAEVMGIPLGTLKTKQAAAIRQLRIAMGVPEDDPHTPAPHSPTSPASPTTSPLSPRAKSV
jgi:RNA polymerase sigma-70 factor (ECF subfamily)